MTPPGSPGTNVAADSAHVDVQAAIVHGDVNHYTVSPEPSPQEKFEAGLRYLEGDMLGRAWELINDAAISGYRTNQACFYWMLTLLSGKTRHELSAEETVRFENSDRWFPLIEDDYWADGVHAIRRLLVAARKHDADTRVLMKEFDALGSVQRGMILRHLESFLDGQLNEEMWRRTLQWAKTERMAGDRDERIWKFFQPNPADPRVRLPEPVTIPGFTWMQAVAGTVVAVATTAHIGYLLAQGGKVGGLLACLLAIAGGYFGAREGVEWRFRLERRRARDEEYAMALHRRTNVPHDAFGRQVDQRLEYYVAKYLPRGMERDVWLAWTAGVRRSIRNELVEAYREKPTRVERINWLIRHRAGDVKRRWENGTMWSYRQELATPLATKATAVLGLLACASGGIWAASGAVQAQPLNGMGSVVLTVAAGWVAARAWLRIILGGRRTAADKSEADALKRDSMAAFARWKDRLADKPNDREMATWLDCDRKMLLSEALQHYKLKMSDVVAYAFIEAPGASTARARVRGGPWRYKKYRLLLFLLTADGVRQFGVTLDFEDCTFHDHHRMNYRFDAVAAVSVKHADDGERTFELALVNHQKISIKVIEPGSEELQQGEEAGAVSEATLDAAGLNHTLHVLEGIAAEGKEWLGQEARRGKQRSGDLSPPPPDEEGHAA
ncbi:hypothetical protein Pth03_56290 [Planotetraspora thailandica]|uniref:Uncharacterized protein n=1 Tax=Planotetraspora thailandica TaxID=487172 RepID=A0A8J3VF53_9ACTN|nr:hypothetical protein [Planotetraspora thailandica]GII57240.1 hypothetical protein Pth03_56290 [Planotetraspora thailandica]